MLKRVEAKPWVKPQCEWRLWRTEPQLTHAAECDLAFRWQHERDWRALVVLVRSFNPLVYGIAGERFRAAQLDKDVKIIDLEKARGADALRLKDADLAGHFLELVQAGQLGLLEANRAWAEHRGPVRMGDQ